MCSEFSPGFNSFGALLRRQRTAAGLSQGELAERAGLSRRGIADLERGARRFPYGDTLRRLADGLSLGPSETRSFVAAGLRLQRCGSAGPHRLPNESVPHGRSRARANRPPRPDSTQPIAHADGTRWWHGFGKLRLSAHHKVVDVGGGQGCGTHGSGPTRNPNACFLSRTYWRTVDSAIS